MSEFWVTPSNPIKNETPLNVEEELIASSSSVQKICSLIEAAAKIAAGHLNLSQAACAQKNNFETQKILCEQLLFHFALVSRRT